MTNSYSSTTLILHPSAYSSLTANWSYASSNVTSYTISGSVFGGATIKRGVPEDQHLIDITFTSGETITITLKEYTIFVALHSKSPSECTKAEYEELSFGERI